VVRNTTNAKTDNHQLKRIWAMDNKAREINSPVIKQLIDETSPEELAKIDAEMENNKELTSIHFDNQKMGNINNKQRTAVETHTCVFEKSKTSNSNEAKCKYCNIVRYTIDVKFNNETYGDDKQ
jgi:hypothetical protein